MRHQFLWVVVAALPLHAQSRLVVTAGAASVHGHAIAAADGEKPELHPDAPTTFTLGVTIDVHRWQTGIALRSTGADIAIVGRTSAVVTRNVVNAVGVAASVARQIAGSSNGPELLAGIALGIDRWTFSGVAGDPRWRPDGSGFAALMLPIRRGWDFTMRASLGLTPSLFTAEELPEGYERRLGWSSGVAAGIGRKL